ncbi:uncharacterized protein F4822DRAFT_215541 [Hypoxylon trugodes]|uniref:uncharacterized protein n=1 Tax=Hypoxylon trugodes TaxID=326681 RepID=UPI00219CDBE3|nr:uncharacterized protein F4822DRAFT_215541 [Hypoxylon trugodes]KAI1389830.1 hypothetical protein F4822DRAFT_215541 [Hypoxylon trugodes]
MRVSSFLATLASTSIASAAVMRLAADSISWSWTVTGWSAGCAKQCNYDFNVTGVGNHSDKPATPSFKAHCSGQGEGAAYEACTALGESETEFAVVAKLLSSNNNTSNGTSHRPRIQVSLKYTDLDSPTTWWNYTGKAEASYNQYAASVLNFTITPDEVFGVA